MKLSLIVPVYKEEKNISPFLTTVLPILSSITSEFEIIFALDPSPDHTEKVILEERVKDNRIKLLTFSRRFGQPMATLAGMQYASGEVVIVIDVDLQDPPELIPEMINHWKEGYDVVYAQRRSRSGEPLLKKIISNIAYRIIHRISHDASIPKNVGDYRLMSRRVVNEVLNLKESHGFLRGMVALVGFSQIAIPFDRPARRVGDTHYNRFFGSIRIGLNGIVCFSNDLLSLTTITGFCIAFLSFLIAIIYAFMKITGFPFPLGNPTIVILILLMSGVQLISVGILGEYIGRIYDEIKARPRFIVDKKIGLN